MYVCSFILHHCVSLYIIIHVHHHKLLLYVYHITRYWIIILLCTRVCTGTKCFGNPVQDVVFVIETSSSIGRYRFQQIQELVANIAAGLISGSPRGAIAVGVILFSRNAHIEFNLQPYTNLSTLLSAINQLPYDRGTTTETAKALMLLLSTAQNGTLQLRNYSSKFAIVITDGDSNNQSATLLAANALHASNIFTVYTVGVGTSYLLELRAIASSPEFIFRSASYSIFEIMQLKYSILQQLCNGT